MESLVQKHSSTSLQRSRKTIVDYYKGTGSDYKTWSKNYNMHFGFGSSIFDLFRREKMLSRMNREVFLRLNLKPEEKEKILDMGCGLSATLREAAGLFPDKELIGVTIVPWQVEKGVELNRQTGMGINISLVKADYTDLPFADNSMDAVYAIESSCHSLGEDKRDFIVEMKRVLKPGHSFAVADGFVKNPELKFNSFIGKCYKTVCDCWALSSMGEISAFTKCLYENGFKNIKVEDISRNVSLSVMHTPFLVLKFIIQKFLKNGKLSRQSIKNLKGVLLICLLGMARRKFGYYLISGTKA